MSGEKIREVGEPIVIRGEGVGRGVAIAPLRFERAGGGRESLLLLERAISMARDEILALRDNAVKEVGEEHGEIFELYLSMLSDSEPIRFIKEEIERGTRLDSAIKEARESFGNALGDRPARATAAHSREVLDLLRAAADEAICGDAVESDKRDGVPASEKYILVSEGDGGGILLDGAVGVVSVGGSESAGLAALAHSKGIPALVVSPEDAPSPKYEGAGAIIDPSRGRLTVNPDLAALDRFTESSALSEEREQRLSALIGKPSVTQSGSYLAVLATAEEGEGGEAASADAEGIGLLRTENLFADLDEKKIEIRHFEALEKLMGIFKEKPINVRTYAGGRGAGSGKPWEKGQRGIRFCLASREIFKSQLKGILRASAKGEVSLLFPFAVSPEEVRRARAVMGEAAAELKREGIIPNVWGVGVMIDTPAAAINAPLLAEESDIFVADTDLLSACALGVDRREPCFSELLRRNTPPVIKLSEMASRALHASGKGKLMGVAGDLAADTDLTEELLGIGADFLSVPPAYVLELRERIRLCP